MKVKVAGAGPAGSVAAISALRNGHDVEVFEEHARSGYPQHCSGLVSKEGLSSLLDMVDYRQNVINEISGAVFDFAGEKFEVLRQRPTACVINRQEFDSSLAARAESEGAKIIYKKRFDAATESADAVVGADGALSSVAYHFKFPKIGKFAFTLKTLARMDIGEPHKVHLFYDSQRFPGFFGWLIPHSCTQAEIGIGTTKHAKLRSGFEFLIRKLRPFSHGEVSGRVIPLLPRKRTAGVFAGMNVLLVGDAAGQVKSSSGGGVVFGTCSARIAGALLECPLDYESTWRKENGNDLLAHALLRDFFSLQPNELLRITAMSSNFLGLSHVFSAYGNMDRPTKILNAFFRNPVAQFQPGQ